MRSWATCSVFHTLGPSDRLILGAIISRKHNLFLSQHQPSSHYFFILHNFPSNLSLSCFVQLYMVWLNYVHTISCNSNVSFNWSYFFFNSASFHASSCYFSLYTQIVSAFKALSLFTDWLPKNLARDYCLLMLLKTVFLKLFHVDCFLFTIQPSRHFHC